MSIHSSPNEELHNNLNEDVIFTPGDMWQSEDEDNKGEDRGARGRRSGRRLITPLVTITSKKVLAKDFKSTDALKMMQEKHTINFRSRRAGCTQARPLDSFFPQFYLNFFSIISKLGQLISRHSRPIFNNITISFQQAKHVSRIPFNITRQTFRIAQASTRKTYPQRSSARASSGHSGLAARHKPAFHAYKYRANIEIEVSEELYDLPQERHYAMDDNDDNDDKTLQLKELSVADNRPRRAEVEGVAGAHRCTHSSHGGINHARYQQIFNEYDGLQKLILELEINRTTKADHLETCCLLADRNMLTREFASTYDYTFYPQAFHLVYRNMLSNCPPIFLNSLFAAMKGNISDQNEGANILSFSYFQGYSNIKRSVRHSPHDLLATKGYATGVLTILTLDARATLVAREKRERLLRIIYSPNKSKPFAREH
ncbi:hypothetical protein RB213_011935 [Colletotrichum asianum]